MSETKKLSNQDILYDLEQSNVRDDVFTQIKGILEERGELALKLRWAIDYLKTDDGWGKGMEKLVEMEKLLKGEK